MAPTVERPGIMCTKLTTTNAATRPCFGAELGRLSKDISGTKYIGSHLEIDCSGKRGLQKVAKASERQNPVILDHVARALTTEIPSSDTAPEAQEDNKIELICAMRVTGGLYRAECDVDCAFAQLWVLVLKSIA